jgi:hypothetical protein
MNLQDFLYPENKTISWTTVIVFAIICGIIGLYRSRSRQKEFEMRRKYFTAVGIVVLSYAAIRFMFILSDLIEWSGGTLLLHSQYVYLGYIFLYVGFYFFIAFFDKYFIDSKRFLITKLYIGIMIFCIVIFLLLPLLIDYEDTARYIFYAGIYYSGLVTLIVILKVLLKIGRKGFMKFLWGFIGIILMLLAGTFEPYIPLPIVPIIVIIGMILIGINTEITIRLLSEYYISKKICLIHRGEIEGKIVF